MMQEMQNYNISDKTIFFDALIKKTMNGMRKNNKIIKSSLQRDIKRNLLEQQLI